MLDVALPKGRLGDKVYGLFRAIGYDCGAVAGDDRRLVIQDPGMSVRFFLVKPSDVAIYVEHGAADIGVVGKDVLLEGGYEVYELLDLGIGRCRMAVAAKTGFREDMTGPLRVATKYPSIARRFYGLRSRDIEVIKLNGSIELAPILGLSDVIVDIVETGTTLRQNDLEVIETIMPISARLIANKASMKFQQGVIDGVMKAISELEAKRA